MALQTPTISTAHVQCAEPTEAQRGGRPRKKLHLLHKVAILFYKQPRQDFSCTQIKHLQHSIAAHSLFLSLSSSFSKCQMVFIAAGGKIERRGLRSLKVLSFPEGTQVCRAQRSLRAHLATVFFVSFKIKNITEGRVKCSNNLRKNFTLFT